jgi:hypothetical protein
MIFVLNRHSTDVNRYSPDKRDIEPNSDPIRFLGNAKPLLLRLGDAIHGRSPSGAEDADFPVIWTHFA